MILLLSLAYSTLHALVFPYIISWLCNASMEVMKIAIGMFKERCPCFAPLHDQIEPLVGQLIWKTMLQLSYTAVSEGGACTI